MEKNKMKLLFIILLEFFSLCADAQTISVVLDWVDTQVETHCDLMILSESYSF